MLSVLTNSIPTEYLYPVVLGASINKRIIFPLASKITDYITVKTGLIDPNDLEY
jgi:hypothetical protein